MVQLKWFHMQTKLIYYSQRNNNVWYHNHTDRRLWWCTWWINKGNNKKTIKHDCGSKLFALWWLLSVQNVLLMFLVIILVSLADSFLSLTETMYSLLVQYSLVQIVQACSWWRYIQSTSMYSITLNIKLSIICVVDTTKHKISF